MEAKEKAKELVKDMMLYSSNKTKGDDFIHYEVSHKIDKELAKECALIAVDRIIKELEEVEFNYDINALPYKYLEEVKLEIEKL